MAREILPVADRAQVRAYARRLTLKYPRQLGLALALHALAAAAGLVAPRMLGDLVEGLAQGRTDLRVDAVALAIGAFVAAQAVLIRFAVYASSRLGEKVLAELRRTSSAGCWRCRSRPSSGPVPATSSPARPGTWTRCPGACGTPCPRR
ncbi:hypothetical protein GCM10027612_81150 [Microbispora bryophytorum subsp. camponoti]